MFSIIFQKMVLCCLEFGKWEVGGENRSENKKIEVGKIFQVGLLTLMAFLHVHQTLQSIVSHLIHFSLQSVRNSSFFPLRHIFQKYLSGLKWGKFLFPARFDSKSKNQVPQYYIPLFSFVPLLSVLFSSLLASFVVVVNHFLLIFCIRAVFMTKSQGSFFWLTQ